MRHCFIINPAAGKGEAKSVPQRLRELFRGREGEYSLHITAAPGDAAAFVAEQCGKAPGEHLRFYACGGDGTAGEVARGVRGRANAALGVLPCGSGNDFVRSFPAYDFSDLAAQLAGDEVPLDLIDFCGRTAVNLCNCGIDADVAHNMPLFRRLPGVTGSGAYQLSILYTFFRPLGKRAEVVLDGAPAFTGRLLLLVCANGQFYGGGYRGAPLARPDDGLLDVCLVPKLSRFRIAGFLGKYQQGLHATSPRLASLVTYRQARSLRARFAQPVTACVDGETFQAEEVTARVLPAAARLILPRRREGLASSSPG